MAAPLQTRLSPIHRNVPERCRRIPDLYPLLACYDLTRTGALPASSGCPTSTSGLYGFPGHADIREIALYIQDTISMNNWTFNLGIRGDYYHGITTANAGRAAPRSSPIVSSLPIQ